MDLVEVERFRAALERHPGLKQRLFTPAEIAYCDLRKNPTSSLAARFAAKEAVAKLLGTGVSVWHDIEVAGRGPEGRPAREWSAEERAPGVVLHGGAAAAAARLGIADIGISLTHVDPLAGACAVVVARPVAEQGRGDGMHGDIDSLSDRPAVFSPAQVRELDRATIEDLGVPGPVLMERAALGVSSLVRARYGAGTLWWCAARATTAVTGWPRRGSYTWPGIRWPAWSTPALPAS